MNAASPEFAPHWQARLRGGFPLLDAMRVEVRGDADGWALHAPFAVNRNDHGTAFGGAISTLATIAGWMAALLAAADDADAVIQSGDTEFLLPIHGDFHARVLPPPADDVARLRRALARGRPGRLHLVVEIRDDADVLAARFAGRYVVQAADAR
ncbi:hypothetical protein GCM10007860_30260 [Chitiniphilus shinanonensis]|uniref:Thioesterase putative domain-containing protein n=1 Tax=Chitiniphilus shinanonensis TaxID=553088 RepID=A0ABQ6BV61_9NEIS|nr:YiiD C-terminal domain-containing protein [Chitiniphilus shinanonensis]GLS05865.1 hypothetical protein GCM10007860_30260 [Chitiniphilus shinanonensis]